VADASVFTLVSDVDCAELLRTTVGGAAGFCQMPAGTELLFVAEKLFASDDGGPAEKAGCFGKVGTDGDLLIGDHCDSVGVFGGVFTGTGDGGLLRAPNTENGDLDDSLLSDSENSRTERLDSIESDIDGQLHYDVIL
jgi:hypothetical protein